MKKEEQLWIRVWGDWEGLSKPMFIGSLFSSVVRGREVFSFEYDSNWISSGLAQSFDPSLKLFKGRQYAPEEQSNFGVFLDSAPDRWGRLLMKRREAQAARDEKRKERTLLESDYLLGVYDGHRMGALRFCTTPDGPFLDHNKEVASPPWTSLRELEHASLELEKENAEKNPQYRKWLRMLIAPGGSLGGARPKASVLGEQGDLWIAKFPSTKDEFDVGAWEEVVHRLAARCGITTSEAMTRKFNSKYHTFLTKRFDRTRSQKRIHFASAMTLLQRGDGDDASSGTSYLEIAGLLGQQGADPNADLEQLWRRIVFFICVSNSDDHLRNHGFLPEPKGWRLAPAYDMNPVPDAEGLRLNISETDNAQSLELAKDVATYFRVKAPRAAEMIKEVVAGVKQWRKVAKSLGISSSQTNQMDRAFGVANSG